MELIDWIPTIVMTIATVAVAIAAILNYKINNRLLSEREKEKILVTASSGNHGAAFAHTFKKFGLNGIIFLPENASKSKIESLRLNGTHLKFYGNDCIKAETKAKDFAKKYNHVFISPYNDPRIIGGQGTIGVELFRQIKKIDAVLSSMRMRKADHLPPGERP